MMRTHLLALVLMLLPGSAMPLLAAPADTAQVDVATPDAAGVMPEGLTLRVRLAAITPAEPMDIAWRYGGEGLGGEVVRGVAAAKLPVGEWSPPIAVRDFVKGRFPARLFLTFTAASSAKAARGGAKPDVPTGAEFEFEFTFGGKVVKTFRESGPDGPTAGIHIPAYRLAGGRTPADPAFLDELTGILEYARRRAASLESLPWAARPVPRQFVIITDVGGYGPGVGYGIRTTNKAVVEVECRSLRQLGVNSLRSAPEFLLGMAARGEGYAAGLGRACDIGIAGYPVPGYRAGRQNSSEAGCPFGTGVKAAAEEAARTSIEKMQAAGLTEVWGLTVDEIGAVIDHSAEGKGHYAACPRCGEAFREWLRGQGLAPADFGAADWAAVRPVDLSGREGTGPDLSTRGGCLAAYYTRQFNNYASARLFTPLRDAVAAANEARRKAIAAGEKDTPAARQPEMFSYALRGNTFLMKGHSLDFFDFYRHADNAFVYEMSNRDPRAWPWDSYLCDVGRVVSGAMRLEFGVYVKPHRGAPVQRALSAAARGARMIYWYTYGPDYKKGDSFSESPEALALTSRAARLLGRAEDVLYRSAWVQPAEVAVVNPRTSEIWMQLTGRPDAQAAWENAKWTYTALAHAHVPVDAIDEVMLAREDLARYKVLYISGPNITRAAADKVARWVEAGGTLVTSGGGLARDEANQPLAALQPVLGLEARAEPEMFYRVSLYGATTFEPYDDARNVLKPVPEGARIAGPGLTTLVPVIGREVLRPVAGTEVLAKFADGGAAMTRATHGKGRAYVIGFFPGLEYSAGVRVGQYDMSTGFDAGRRAYLAAPALAAVKPVVDAGRPTVEGVLVRGREGGRMAVVLMNWAYRVADPPGKAARPAWTLVPCQDLKVTVRGAGAATKAVSAALDKPLAVERAGDVLTITVPRLDEGDVLLLE